MFTGLVEVVGSVASVTDKGEAREFSIALPDLDYLRGAVVGESIAVNGTCLTVVELTSDTFSIQAIEETLRRTTLGGLSQSSRVNLERAMKADARFGGHIVQGHVDGVGTIQTVREEGEGWWITIEPPRALLRYLVEKGSVCVDGISLTVANVAYSTFSVAIIPHTREVTTAGDWQPGVPVNLEVDIIAKHIERLLEFHALEKSVPASLAAAA